MSGDDTAWQVGAYYFPNYHEDTRNAQWRHPGWTEWELVKTAVPRFPGHMQPKSPLWGFEDESDPTVMERKIDSAADHGIDFWIFDWYWYDDGPFLERCLERGYMGAENNSRVKFCCMWANHDWIDLHPARLDTPKPLLYQGKVSPETFRVATDHIIRTYFTHPSYFTVDDAPYFSFYDIGRLVESHGGIPATRAALDDFRRRALRAGFPRIHLNAVAWGTTLLPGESAAADSAELIGPLGFDSATSYVWVHHADLGRSPDIAYDRVRDSYLTSWKRMTNTLGVPYFPNVTMGWDPSPRTSAEGAWSPTGGYPFTPCVLDNTPMAFHESLQLVKARQEQLGIRRIVTLNAWNEWTEGSYLEPDTTHGTHYLEAVRDAFARHRPPTSTTR